MQVSLKFENLQIEAIVAAVHTCFLRHYFYTLMLSATLKKHQNMKNLYLILESTFLERYAHSIVRYCVVECLVGFGCDLGRFCFLQNPRCAVSPAAEA